MRDELSRRKLLVGVSCAAPTFALGGYLTANAQSKTDCSAIDRLILSASDATISSSTWALTQAPDAILAAKAALNELKQQLDKGSKDLSAAERKTLLGKINAAGSAIIFILGVTSAVATAPLVLGSITFSATLILAQPIVVPQSVDAISIVTDVSASRLGAVLSVMGDDAYAISRTSAQVSRSVSHLLGFVGSAYAAIEAARASAQASEIESAVVSLRQNVASAIEILNKLESQKLVAECSSSGI